MAHDTKLAFTDDEVRILARALSVYSTPVESAYIVEVDELRDRINEALEVIDTENNDES